MSEETHIINHLGEDREHYHNSVVPPIFQSSIFSFNSVNGLREGLKDEFGTPFYTRGHNPTVAILRKKMAALEHAEDALIFASGSAAIAAAVMSQAKKGDHVVCVDKPYSWTNKLLTGFLADYGVEYTFVDGRNPENVANAVQENTTLVFLETPNSVSLEMQDIAAIREKVGPDMCIAVDNSYSTPIFQNPIDLGADIVVHSASKYISGHSDVVGGVLCASSEIVRAIFKSEFMTLGGIISPNDAWLLLRGLRTLPMRIREVEKVTQEVLHYLEAHDKVEKIYYPMLESNEQYELAKKQMKGAGGLFSMEIKANSMADVENFCNNLPSFLITCSWGGYESLLFPTCALYESQNYGSTDLPWNLIRFYIGHEDPKSIIGEFENAFKLI